MAISCPKARLLATQVLALALLYLDAALSRNIKLAGGCILDQSTGVRPGDKTRYLKDVL